MRCQGLPLHAAPARTGREAERPALPLPALDGLTQSTGFHDMAPLRAADQGGLTYAFLSPVFDSVSKVGYKSARFDEQELRSTLAACPRPVYALGGVTPDRVPQLADLGFAGAAVIGHVWGSDDPVGSLRALLDAAERV
ncbi:unnamed protein product [Pedinophyceae sp. YPF-701]|nr:unnamed protein product [Pedinophyceae sp. YPF-701]